MNISILKDLGLNEGEIRTYLALLDLESSATGPLCEKSGIQSSHIYSYLASLQEKGLVSYSTRNARKIFHPSPPEALIELQRDLRKQKEETFQQQESDLQELIKNLVPQIVQKGKESPYRYFENISGIKGLWSTLTERLPHLPQNSIIKIYSADKESSNRLLAFYDEFHKVRLKLGLRYRLIISPEMEAHGKKRSKQLAEVRILPLKNECTWGIIGDMFIMYTTTGKQPRAFLILDEKFAQTYSNIFSELWTQAKPLFARVTHPPSSSFIDK